MKRIAICVGLAVAPMTVLANNWQLLSGEAALAALEDRKLVYDNGAWQEFRASGRTLYNAGEDSWGYWAIRDGQYCSQWPPADLWACYDLSTDGAVIRFTGAAGDVTDGRYAE